LPSFERYTSPANGDRGGVVIVAWGAVGGRSAELADALGARSLCLFPPSSRKRPHVLIRYAIGAVRTGNYLLRLRPFAVVVTNPPIVAGLITYGWSRLIGATIVLDSHPGGFGAQNDRVAARLQSLHKWLVRRSAFSMVCSAKWREIVNEWGGDAEIIHEAPGDWNCVAPERNGPLRVLYVGRFAPDEPVELVIAAAASVPEIDIAITGDHAAPSNVEFVGFLDAPGYRDAVVKADVILCLTTEPGSVMRSAYEAVYACRPLIVSGWPVAKEVFPYALHTENSVSSLAKALKVADSGFDELVAHTDIARELQLSRFARQQAALVQRLTEISRRE
jgi:glycosyltransferase involved in cell wall biosynthesis